MMTIFRLLFIYFLPSLLAIIAELLVFKVEVFILLPYGINSLIIFSKLVIVIGPSEVQFRE